MLMPGIVACEALYNLVERFAPGSDVRYIPAELHEFPTNVPLTEAIHERVQAAIDGLDTPSRDTIVVSYAVEDAGSELTTAHASLIVSQAADCISTVLPAGNAEYGEDKAPGTLYLTRGWIDCGVDSYKLYRTYRGDLAGLLSQFEEASTRHDDLRVSWHQGQRFKQTRDRPAPTSAELTDDFFRSIVEHYHRVALVDTGDLYPFHREYAEQVHGFIDRLHQGSDHAESVTLDVVEGSTTDFRRLVRNDLSSGS